MFTTRRGTTFGLMSRVENPLFDDPSGTPEPAAGQGETVSVEDGGPVSQSGGRTASVPAILARPEKPANLAELLRIALLKRWDTLSFSKQGKCDFSSAHRLKAFITNVQLQLATRQASFLMHWRVENDSDLQMIAQLALVEAMPLAKKSMIQRHVSFTAAWDAVMHQYSLLRRADAVRIQCELVNIAQKSDESVLSYVDRVESLWQELEGTSLTVPEVYAVDHMRRGMSPDHGALFSLFTSTAAESFETVRRIVLSNIDARVSRNASGGGDAAALRSQLQQLQLQHAQLQQRVDGGGPNRSPQGGNHFSQGGNRSNSSNRTTWYCRMCRDKHPKGPNTCPRRRHEQGTVAPAGSRAPVGQFQHTIGNAELSTVENGSTREVCAVDGDIPLFICADSGATNVVTPDRTAISNYVPFPANQGHVRLADKSTGSRAEGYGNLTLRSKSTGSTLTFTNVLHMPSARRTLVCLGKSMKSGVFWHFDRIDGGSIEVSGKGYWGDIVLAQNDLLFLHAEIQYPGSHPAVPAAVVPTVQYVEVSNAELFHRRLGHPGRSATKQLVTLEKVPAGADAPLPYHCRPCLMGKATQVPRGPPVRAAIRCLERLHFDLMGPISPVGRSGEHYLLVVTDEYSGYAEAIPLVFKSSAVDALIDLIAVFENQLQPLRVTEFHSDQGREFDNSVLDAYAAQHGITHRLSPAYTPQSNGRAERQNRALKELTIVLMSDMQIAADLWPEVVRYASCYLLNRRPRKVSGNYHIPYEVFTGHPAQYQHLRIIGSPCEVTIKQKEPRPKFAPRTAPGVLLGYASDGRNNTCVYRVYLPSLGQVQNVVDVHIIEPSRRALLQEPAPPAAAVTPPSGGERARGATVSNWSPPLSETPPASSPACPGVSSEGPGGSSASGAPLSPVPATPAGADPRAPDASGHVGVAGSSSEHAPPPAPPQAPPPIHRAMRSNRGVPAPTFDGSAAAIEAPAKFSCPPPTHDQGSVGSE